MLSTLLLVGIYLIVSIAAQAYAGTDFLRHNKDDVLSALGGHVFGSPLDKLLIIAVLTSASPPRPRHDPANGAHDAGDGEFGRRRRASARSIPAT